MMKLLDDLTAALSERYAIERELGRGGMATVFLARDLKHRRPVAVKVLHPELSVSVGPERFLREIEIAASLAHPHILPLHDSGDAGGYLFYVMPYVEGDTVRDRLDRSRPLPVEEALAITRDVASALAYAHGRGVVHRDIKPENILLAGGEAVVADFGIAKAIGFISSVTQPGLAIGSPLYMSPEQAMGDSDIDGRSDLYSLGCVMYELLAGEPPFHAETVLGLMARHTTEPPPALSRARPGAPEHLEPIITRLLQKQAADRFATARELLDALDGPRAGIRFTVARQSTPAMPRVTAEGRMSGSIAVLPFRDLSAAKDQEYLCEGIAEDVLATLSRIPALRVASRSSSFAYRGRDADARTIGKELNVATVLEGSVNRQGDRLRINVELSNTTDGFQIWSERYARQITDVFEIQEEIATSIAASLRITLTGTAGRVIIKRHTDKLEAYEHYLRGRHLWNRRHEGGLQQSLEAYQKALEADPLYPLPYAGLADAIHALSAYEYISASETVAKVIGLASKAISLNASLPEPHITLGSAKAHSLWEWDEGEAEMRKAIELDPEYAIGWFWLGQLRLARGDVEGCMGGLNRSLALDPLNMAASAIFGWSYTLSRQYDMAISHMDTVVRLVPEMPLAHAVFGSAYACAGRLEESLPHLARGAGMPGAHYLRGHVLGKLGRPDEALKELDEMKARSASGWVSPYGRALVTLGMGDRDGALDLLEAAAAERSFQLSFSAVHPLLDELRGEPRFHALMQRMHLADVSGAVR